MQCQSLESEVFVLDDPFIQFLHIYHKSMRFKGIRDECKIANLHLLKRRPETGKSMLDRTAGLCACM